VGVTQSFLKSSLVVDHRPLHISRRPPQALASNVVLKWLTVYLQKKIIRLANRAMESENAAEIKKQKKSIFAVPTVPLSRKPRTARLTAGVVAWIAAIPTTPATPLLSEFSAFGLVGIDTV
jgi:hypothetical protein